jgi:general secretion pathway protein C
MKINMKMNMNTRPGHLIAIVVLIAIILASTIYWIVRISHSSSLSEMRGLQVSAPIAAAAPLSAVVALFGEQPEMAPAIGNLRATGVVIAPDPNDSIAILGGPERARAFRVGAEIVPGVHLVEVHRQYVVLSDGQHSTRIELPERAAIQAPPAMENESPQAAPSSQIDDGSRGEPPHRSGGPDEEPQDGKEIGP